MAQLRQAAGAASEQVEMERSCSIGELLKDLADRHGSPFRDLVLDASGCHRPALLLFAGDEQVGPERETQDYDLVTVLTPMAGG
jgi:molybdopterin converting factor small subunit